MIFFNHSSHTEAVVDARFAFGRLSREDSAAYGWQNMTSVRQ